MDHAPQSTNQFSVNRLALSATVHCLTGCSIGEVFGMVIASSMGWDNMASVTVAAVLAYAFGYLLTLLPLLRAGLGFSAALSSALASDTLSITIMEIVDNAVMLVIPGAMNAGFTEPRFWGNLICSLILAGIAAFPVNRWLIARGRGHALAHKHDPPGANYAEKGHLAGQRLSKQ